MNEKGYKRSSILGVNVDNVTVADVHELISTTINDNSKHQILNVNLHALNIAYDSPSFRNILNRSKMVFVDGHGVKLAARLMGVKIKEVITYGNWIWQLSGFCVDNQFSIFILGGRKQDLDLGIQKLQAAYPKIKICGFHHGYFNKDGDENTAVIDLINQCKPNILLVSFGMPIQEQWIDANWEKLSVNILLSGGGLVDLISGRAPTPPWWVDKYGLRWAFRLTYEPKRVFRRYVIGIPEFFLRFLVNYNLNKKQIK